MASRDGRTADRGQAFPLYVVVVAGLLFAALALFVVGQASATRSDAQGAADAAALAAARHARDHLVPGLVLADLEPAAWEKILDGERFFTEDACEAAEAFAEKNAAEATTCVPSPLRFTVAVKTHETVGKSVIPGTDVMHGTADATAVIKPRCHLGELPAGETRAPTESLPAEPGRFTIQCEGGKEIAFDPKHPGTWNALARKMFDVYLTD
ncbi:hypothetical protein AMK16_10335 [Streptomyces sp. CB00455]|uniref:pilus assembly protein TadG-related protein n=1 Tax=Streptomyces sp. CB00455 TaxID=1703927 RepID=UPI00093EF774|nr:pilus assembly protein TadG-related protein [Streptomyces sp. CB00455]OKK20808.1 hypothetical protein AMK16_10335 [Streptomyces sp. CB00455]